MAYTKNEKGDAPKMRRGGRRRKKYVYSAAKRTMRLITKM